MTNQFKIAALCCALFLSLASISSAHAYDSAQGRGVIGRMINFVAGLLEPAVFDARSNRAEVSEISESALKVEAADPGIAESTSAAPPQSSPSTHSDWMPFMSVARLRDEAQ